MTVILRDEAAAELEEAFEHYQGINGELAGDLVSEFRRGVDQIIEHPGGWQSLDQRYRRYRLHRFPYGIVYRADFAADIIVVVAFMHLSRRPNFWRGRDR
jgi:plasmid stabilization system protein ParE